MSLIKLAAIDIDGTLLDDSGNIPEKNLKALQKASTEYGISIALCTGRGASAFEIAKKLQVACHLILANGVYIFDNILSRPIVKNYLKESAKIEILSFLEQSHFDVDYYIVLGFEEDFHMIYKWRDNHDTYFLNFVKGRQLHKPTYPQKNLLDFAKSPISHIGIVGRYDKLKYLADIFKNLSCNINVILYYASDNKDYGFLEILDIESSKEKALLKLLKIKSINPENVLAIGDNFNDTGMFEIANVSVAVANAPDEVKRLAKFVTCATNNQGAIAEAFERFVFCKKQI
ncbi:Cof-type HAD-IIB family hydrolase [Caldicellulosiruptor morganii]|uniref:Cof-type HAD-IIB family hydrolase n=1 Tax=Caldicellulosiruptor morganii TaxID=1387555 RepID=A0ABY7BLI3_9FIRM|nr:Cof-type HAD-IIB family hydrolase [Caldicellulosiruptor morganii]WAM33157.1 Cof-type HAD-IIB family hydrolase [Caldicellulosiruptor morganii]